MRASERSPASGTTGSPRTPPERAAHTPGPWTSRRDDLLEVESIEAVVGGRRLMLAMAHSYSSGSIDHDTRAANANLMAASPDLLKALKWDAEQVYAIFSSDLGGDLPARIAAVQEHVTAWRAAIAKAEGQS